MSWPVLPQSIAEAALSGRWIIKVSSTSENIKSPERSWTLLMISRYPVRQSILLELDTTSSVP